MDDSKCPGNNLAISPDDVSRIKIRIDGILIDVNPILMSLSWNTDIKD